MSIGPAASRTQEINTAKLAGLFRKQLELCNVKKGETVAVVTDPGTRPEYVLACFAAADDLGADAYQLGVNSVPGGWTRIGVPTIGRCKGTVEALKMADIIVIFHVALFSSWLKEVRRAGVRVQQIIDSPDDLLELQAPKGLKEAVLYADSLYAKAKRVQVTSEAGTDLTYSVGDYPVMSQYGYADLPGRFDHWGGGHVHTFPNEGSANGTVILKPGDIAILPYCRFIIDPVRLEIRDGFITSIKGGLDADLLRSWLDDCRESEVDRDPYAISHLGWGLNPQALWYWMALKGDTPERQRAATRAFPGNFLFSTGPNTEGGGTRRTKGHYDAPMRDCTIALDGKVIIEKGRIADERMKVAREPRR
jgi:2,5-dihydroxypyridine 5,6-dioxygenase